MISSGGFQNFPRYWHGRLNFGRDHRLPTTCQIAQEACEDPPNQRAGQDTSKIPAGVRTGSQVRAGAGPRPDHLMVEIVMKD
jgi:hypothetical protein